MADRACLCGAEGCHHGRRRRTRGTAPHPYGLDHQQRREWMLRYTPPVCVRCGQGPRANDPWEAGHRDAVALGGGPDVQREHRSCNRRHGARLAMAMRAT